MIIVTLSSWLFACITCCRAVFDRDFVSKGFVVMKKHDDLLLSSLLTSYDRSVLTVTLCALLAICVRQVPRDPCFERYVVAIAVAGGLAIWSGNLCIFNAYILVIGTSVVIHREVSLPFLPARRVVSIITLIAMWLTRFSPTINTPHKSCVLLAVMALDMLTDARRRCTTTTTHASCDPEECCHNCRCRCVKNTETESVGSRHSFDGGYSWLDDHKHPITPPCDDDAHIQ